MLNRGAEGSQAVAVPYPHVPWAASPTVSVGDTPLRHTQVLPESDKPTPGCGRTYTTTRGRPASSLPQHHEWRRRWPYAAPRLRDRRWNHRRVAQVQTDTQSAGSPTRGPKPAGELASTPHERALVPLSRTNEVHRQRSAPRGDAGGPTQRDSRHSANCLHGGRVPRPCHGWHDTTQEAVAGHFS